MAKPSRADRRARRLAQQQPAVAGAGAPPPPDTTPVRMAPEPPARPERERGSRGGGLFRFLGECVAELRKVDWPGQSQVIQGTVVVIIACIIIGFYLYVADEVMRRVVNALLGQ